MAAGGEPEAGNGRTLADILREAGIQAEGRGGRRRRPEPDAPPAPPEGPTAGTASEPPRPADTGETPASEPVAGGDDPAESAPQLDRPSPDRRVVVGWMVFAAELVGAAGVGIAVWFAFSLLWDRAPYVAAVLAAVVLAGLVTTSQLLRRSQQREPLEPLAIAALLLVAAMLTVLPAAALLARS